MSSLWASRIPVEAIVEGVRQVYVMTEALYMFYLSRAWELICQAIHTTYRNLSIIVIRSSHINTQLAVFHLVYSESYSMIFEL